MFLKLLLLALLHSVSTEEEWHQQLASNVKKCSSWIDTSPDLNWGEKNPCLENALEPFREKLAGLTIDSFGDKIQSEKVNYICKARNRLTYEFAQFSQSTIVVFSNNSGGELLAVSRPIYSRSLNFLDLTPASNYSLDVYTFNTNGIIRYNVQDTTLDVSDDSSNGFPEIEREEDGAVKTYRWENRKYDMDLYVQWVPKRDTFCNYIATLKEGEHTQVRNVSIRPYFFGTFFYNLTYETEYQLQIRDALSTKDAGPWVTLKVSDCYLESISGWQCRPEQVKGLNVTVTPSSNNGSSINGSSVNGSSINGSSVNGSSINESSNNGSSVNGSSINGSSVNGSSINGSSNNGSSVNGSSNNGSSVNGSSVNGSSNSTSSDVHVSWKKLRHPVYVSIIVDLKTSGQEPRTHIVPWNETSYVFQDVILGDDYLVQVRGSTVGGGEGLRTGIRGVFISGQWQIEEENEVDETNKNRNSPKLTVDPKSTK